MVDTKYSIFEDREAAEIIEDTILSCTACQIDLVQCIITKDSKRVTKVQAICPKCGDKTFIKKIKGLGYIGSCSDQYVVEDIKVIDDPSSPGDLHMTVEFEHGSK